MNNNPNTSALPAPLWLITDDNPGDEIFPRLEQFFVAINLPGWKEFYQAIIKEQGVVHEHPWLAVAWSTGDLNELKGLLQDGRKALVQMDINFKDSGQSNQYGLELTESLLSDPEIKQNTVFLLKTRTEAAFADAFRRRNVSYLRILRSLNGGEAAERIQFMAANTLNLADDADYEVDRIGNLFLGLQEEAYLDIIRKRYLSPADRAQVIASLVESNCFGVFKGNSYLVKKYVEHFLSVVSDETTIPNVKASPLSLGQIGKRRRSDGRLSQMKKLFLTGASEANALELALLRYGVVAYVEAPLFVLGVLGSTKSQEIAELKKGSLSQKWRPTNFSKQETDQEDAPAYKLEVLSLLELSDVADALKELDQIVATTTSSGKLPVEYVALRDQLKPEALLESNLLKAAIDFVHLRTFIRNYCSEIGSSLAVPALNKLEKMLRVEHGFKVLPTDVKDFFSLTEEGSAIRVQRFPWQTKVFHLFNRNLIAHNIVYADQLLAEAGESPTDDLLIEALSLDPQCPSALQHLAKIALDDGARFTSLVRSMDKERILVGLPHPDKMKTLFSKESSSQCIRDFEYFCRDQETGYECSLMELVISGLMVLRYHVESFLRLLSWNTETAISEDPEIYATLATLWEKRGWGQLFAPVIPKANDSALEIIDPLRGSWGAEMNLLEKLTAGSDAAAAVKVGWDTSLEKYQIEQSEDGVRAMYHSEPPDWLRLFWLGLPLDFADELVNEVGMESFDAKTKIMGSNEQNDGLEKAQKKAGLMEGNHSSGIIDLIEKRGKDGPYILQGKLQKALEDIGSSFTIKEPTSEYTWREDEEFLDQIGKALEIISEQSND